jgi:sulfur carrier protein ThiS
LALVRLTAVVIFRTAMQTIQIYEKPMCCPTGVCGPEVDPVLPQFAADLQWLKANGHQVERYNLAQQPQAFVQNTEVHQLLATQGTNCLPLIAVNGRIVCRQAYPTRDQLAGWIDNPLLITPDTCGGPAPNDSQACCGTGKQSEVTVRLGCPAQATDCC